MSSTDDQRVVTVTVAKLKAFEQAVHRQAQAKLDKFRTSDALDAAKAAYHRAVEAESDAIDSVIATSAALKEQDGGGGDGAKMPPAEMP